MPNEQKDPVKEARQLLTEEQLKEIEARAEAAPPEPWQAEGGQIARRESDQEKSEHARKDVPALCRTLRAVTENAKSQKIELLQLSGRGDLLTKEHVNFDSLDPVAAVRNEFDRLRNIVIPNLQSENTTLRERFDADHELLEKTVKERNALREQLAQVKIDLRDAQAWIADVEEREAATCPEDTAFDEHIRTLQSRLARYVEKVKELRDNWKKKGGDKPVYAAMWDTADKILLEIQSLTLDQVKEKP